MGNTFIVKTNQWGKFSGQEHVPVVGTGNICNYYVIIRFDNSVMTSRLYHN